MTVEQNAIDLRSVFASLAGSNVLVSPNPPTFTILAVSDDYLLATGRTRNELVGKGLFEAFPNNPADPDKSSEKTVRASLEYVLHHKEVHHLPVQRYDIPKGDSFEVRYWQTSNKPLLTENGNVGFLIHTAEDVTGKILMQEQETRLKSLEKSYQLFMNAPVIIGIVRGDNHIIELANEDLLEVWGRTADVIGKPLEEAIPELKGQGFTGLLDEVRKTGEPYFAYETPITLVRQGKPEVLYFDFVYKPLYDSDSPAVADAVFAIGHNVTEKVHAKQKVQESEQKYHHLFKAMNQGFCIVEILYNDQQQACDYRFLEVNPVFAQQTGLQNAAGKTARELVPNLEQHWIDRYAQVAETGQSIQFIEGSAAMGRWFNGFAFRFGDGQSNKVALLFTDISHLKKTEVQLHEIKERFDLVSKATQDAIWDWNLTTNEVWWNEGFKTLFGYKEEEIEPTAESWYSRIHPDDKEKVITSIHDTIDNGGKNWSKEYRFRRKDGSYATVLDRGYALHNEAGQPYRMLGAMQDITPQVQARREAEESAQQVRSLVESAPFPIGVYIGREMRIAFVNQSIIDVWGKGPDVAGKTYAEVLPELASQHIYQQLDKVFMTGIPFQAKNQQVNLVVDGRLQAFYFNYNFTPLFNSQGKVYGVMNTAAEVTDLVVAKQQVEQSERNFRSIILQSPVAMCILLGPEHVVDIANDAMIALWGKKREAVMHKPIFEALPDTRKQGLESLLSQVYTTGESFHAAERPVELLRNGKLELTYQNFVYEPYRDADGHVLGVLAISIDVTEQVLARQKIEQAEQKARIAIESADLGTYDMDLTNDQIITSPRFQTIWGVKDTTDRNVFAQVIHPDDLAVRNKALAEAMQTGNLNYEIRLVHDNKKIRWVRARGEVLFDEQQRPERMVGVVQDITEHKQFAEELKKRVEEQTEELLHAQQDLLQTNDYFQFIINRFESALAVLSPIFDGDKIVDFRFKMTNYAYTQFARLSPSALQGRIVSEIFPNYFLTDAFQRYIQVYQSGEPQNWELHYHFDGLNVHLLVAASKMNDEVIVNLTDVTVLKNLQLDLLRKIAELEHSNQNLEEFTYAASHDLKEPIRKVHVFSGRLKDSLAGRLTEMESNFFERIELAAKRMSTLIDDLLTYSEVGHREAFADDVNMNELIRQVLNDLDLEIEQKQAMIQVQPLFTIKGHQRQLLQAFQNLIGNALKYSKADVPPIIEISCAVVKGNTTGLPLTADEQDKEFYQITVKDNGIGFAQADAERIFNVFTRLHGRSEYKGTGIGLSIVRKVVQNHNGHIWARSEEGKGASFYLLLPAHR